MTHASEYAASSFLALNQLPDSYVEEYGAVAKSLAAQLSALRHDAQHTAPIVLGVNGCQGSGKSTFSAFIAGYLQQHLNWSIAVFSIDDFYLTLEARQALSRRQHPLFLTRGVPGTHDVELALSQLKALGESEGEVKLCRFDKAIDDRVAEASWPSINLPVDLIILEGWCVGAKPQAPEALIAAINQLEREQDQDAAWRQQVNRYLSDQYQILFSKLDLLVMLKAPSFDTVFDWRLEQEKKLIEKRESNLLGESDQERPLAIMDEQQIHQFVQYFQRLTEHMLDTLVDDADMVICLDASRHITKAVFKWNVNDHD